MRHLHPARRRLLIGGLLLAATFFYAFAGTCGLLGQAIAYASSRLIGQTGSTLMAFVLFGSALAFLIPHGGVSAFVRWVQFGREGRVAKVAHELDTYESERRRYPDVVTVLGDTALPSSTGERPAVRGRRGRGGTPIVSGEIDTGLAPRDRMKLDTVREALKGLGYKKAEYGPQIGRASCR